MTNTAKEKTLYVQFTAISTGDFLNSTVVYMPANFGSAKENTPEEENEFEMVRYAVEKKTGLQVKAFSSRNTETLEGAIKFMYDKHCAYTHGMKSSLSIFETSTLMEEYTSSRIKAHASVPVEMPARYDIYIGEDRPTGRSIDGETVLKWEPEHDGTWMKSEDVIFSMSKLQADNEVLAKNLKGNAALTGATYATIISQRDNLQAQIDPLTKRVDQLESFLKYIINSKSVDHWAVKSIQESAQKILDQK